MLDQNSYGNEQAGIEQAKLIKYFDDFGKQMSSRRTNGAGLEQQLLSLSKAYNQAQQKLLQTQRTLMNESILLEKQRSVLEIYKYVLTEQMDDEGILTFIQHLEEEQSNTEIFDQLEIIKSLINRKKVKGCKRQIEEDRAVRELKRELAKNYEEKQEFEEESSIISNQNYELKTKLAQIEGELAQCKNELSQVKQQLIIKSQKKELEERKNKHLEEQLRSKSFLLEQYKNNERKYKKTEEQLYDLKGFLKAKIEFHAKERSEGKENQQSNRSSSDKQDGDKIEEFRQFMKILDQRVSHLLKYRTQYKKMKENVELTQFLKKETSLLKLFLSEQALRVFKEFQDKKMDCIETQIRNLAVLEKNNVMRLQQCQRDVWRYKIMLLKDGEQSNMTNSTMFYSKQGTNFTIDTTNQRVMIAKINKESAVSANTALPQDVSQFYA